MTERDSRGRDRRSSDGWGSEVVSKGAVTVCVEGLGWATG